MVRPATIDDLDWIVGLAMKAHPAHEIERLKKADIRVWLGALLADPNTIAVRGEHGAAFAIISTVPWDHLERSCELAHLFSSPSSDSATEPLALLRAINTIRERMGCRRFWIVSTGADLTPFAMKLGARPIGSLHVLGGDE
jgi:hypothetical protein